MILKILRFSLLSAACLSLPIEIASAETLSDDTQQLVKTMRNDWFLQLRKNVLTAYPAPKSIAANQDRKASNFYKTITGERRALAETDKDQSKAYLYETFAKSALGSLADNADLANQEGYSDIRDLFNSATSARDKKKKSIRSMDFILKDQFKRGRPYQVINKKGEYIKRYEKIKGSSFPSGHTWEGFKSAITNSLIFPERGAELFSRAIQFGESRVILGVHFPTDTIASRIGTYNILSQLLEDDEIAGDIVDVSKALRRNLAGLCNGPLRQCLEREATPVFDAHASKNFEVGYYGVRTGKANGLLSPDLIPEEASYLLRLRFPYLKKEDWRDILAGTAYPEQSLAGWFVTKDKGTRWGLINLPAAYNGPSYLYRTMTVDQSAGGRFDIADFGGWDIWKNDISGPGRLVKQGDGTLVLAGNNSFGGLDIEAGRLSLTGHNALSSMSYVRGGELIINGSLSSDVSVIGTGRISGSGNIPTLSIGAGATVAPGNSIGTLNVGNIHFKSGSTYEVEVNAKGENDLILASGEAVIDGGTVNVKAGSGAYKPRTYYQILSATDGIKTGNGFDKAVSDLAFLTPLLRYDAKSVYLLMDRNDVAFCLPNASSNQCATGKGVETLRTTANPLYETVLNLDRKQAALAFDQLSGETYASTKTVLLNDSLFMRDIPLNRMQSVFGKDVPAADTQPVAKHQAASIWSQGYGSWGKYADNGNAAELKQSLGGIMIGLDSEVSENWILGASGGYSSSSLKIDQRNSSNNIDTYHIGLYGGAQWDKLGLRLGVNQAWHKLDASRTVDIFGQRDKLTAEYDANSTQLYGEINYTVKSGAFQFEPFAGLTHSWLRTDGFNETGNAAALSVARDSVQATFSTLGLRASVTTNIGYLPVSATAMAGWRHAEGDIEAASRHSFQNGTDFTVSGVSLARNGAVFDVGLSALFAESGTLGLSYSGSSDKNNFAHGVKANLSWSF